MMPIQVTYDLNNASALNTTTNIDMSISTVLTRYIMPQDTGMAIIDGHIESTLTLTLQRSDMNGTIVKCATDGDDATQYALFNASGL